MVAFDPVLPSSMRMASIDGCLPALISASLARWTSPFVTPARAMSATNFVCITYHQYYVPRNRGQGGKSCAFLRSLNM